MAKILEQNRNRQTWVETDTPAAIADHIQEESTELVDAIKHFDTLPNGEYSIISEVGDILYLTLKFCGDMGIDPTQAVELKLLRNSLKYPDHFASNGWDYHKARELSKSLWEALGGDNAFYLWHSLVNLPE